MFGTIKQSGKNGPVYKFWACSANDLLYNFFQEDQGN